MVESFTTGASGLKSNGELLFRLILPNKFAEAARAQLELERAFVVGADSGDEAIRVRVQSVFWGRHFSLESTWGVYRVRGLQAKGLDLSVQTVRS